jgi:serine/threonine-protein kinase
MGKSCGRPAPGGVALPAVLEGKDQPRDAAEALAFARLCERCHRQYAAAARFYAEAFAAQPQRAEELNGHRYDAACAAALAGCGRGEEADKPDDKEKVRLRGQALEWVRADLQALADLPDKAADPARSAAAVGGVLKHWQADPDLAGVRGAEALAQLPEAQRQEWRKLWDDAAEMLAHAQARATPEKKPDAK